MVGEEPHRATLNLLTLSVAVTLYSGKAGKLLKSARKSVSWRREVASSLNKTTWEVDGGAHDPNQIFIVFRWKQKWAFGVGTWWNLMKPGLELQRRNTSSYCFLLFVHGMNHYIVNKWAKKHPVTNRFSKTANKKDSTRLEELIKASQPLAFAFCWWWPPQRALMWVGVAFQGWSLLLERLGQWQVLFKESRYFLEGTNFYRLTAVYLGNSTNIGLAG